MNHSKMARFKKLQKRVRNKAEQDIVVSSVEILEYLSRVVIKEEIEYNYDMFGNEHENKGKTKYSAKSAELLGKRHGLFSEKAEAIGITIHFNGEDTIEDWCRLTFPYWKKIWCF